jgi:hypothetical protein
MLPLQVAWYLPLPIPSNKLALTIHKLTCKTLLPVRGEEGWFAWLAAAQRSYVITGSTVGIYSRNWMIIWRLVINCTKKTSEHKAT